MPSAELAEYFTAERQGGFVLVALALAGFAFAAFLLLSRSAFKAMAWPLSVLGAFQLVIGLAVALRTPAQVASLEKGLLTARAQTVAAEMRRMDTVNRNFRVIKTVEAALIGLGVLLAMLLPMASAWAAVGLGLLTEAALLLAFDAFAHHRAEAYVQWLRAFAN